MLVETALSRCIINSMSNQIPLLRRGTYRTGARGFIRKIQKEACVPMSNEVYVQRVRGTVRRRLSAIDQLQYVPLGDRELETAFAPSSKGSKRVENLLVFQSGVVWGRLALVLNQINTTESIIVFVRI